MRIAVVTTFYSEGMGYTENCLPKVLAELGHQVDVITSNLNVYGNQSDYDQTYAEFLGPADQGTGRFQCDGYTVHRLHSARVGRYVRIRGLATKLRELKPDIVHCLEIASFHTFQAAALRFFFGFRLFAETHQHLSVVRSYLKDSSGHSIQKFFYGLTRTMPTWLSSFAVEKCYAISPDCAFVATKFYGVPSQQISVRPLGTDTTLFRPVSTPGEISRRDKLRGDLGYGREDILCIYTGRFSEAKNPLLLAMAVERLAVCGLPYHSIFAGEGAQRQAIAQRTNSRIVPFVRHRELAQLYQIVDIAVWPKQESMSMLDAAAAGIPIVVSKKMGENDRVLGNGCVYEEDSVDDMANVLRSLSNDDARKALGAAGRLKMVKSFSWIQIAKSIEADFAAAIKSKRTA